MSDDLLALRGTDRVHRLAPRRLVAAAGAGSVAMASATWWVAATPMRWSRPLLVPGYVVFYLGLAALTVDWLMLGRLVLAGDGRASARLLRRFIVCGAAPFALAAPLGRDLWAYAAQGNLVAAGVDPYRYGPSAAPGTFTREVSARWIDAPSPYGPVWLRLSEATAWLSHGHPLLAALLLRLPSFAGLALCCWALPVLAHRLPSHLSDRLPVALWLGAASPLMLVLGVGGGHNDLLMLGLGLTALAFATRPGLGSLAVGAGIGAVGVLVKSPAAIAVAFTVPVWLQANRSTGSVRRVGSACGVAVAGSAVVITGLSAVSGLGFGWTKQVDSDATWVSWLSLPSGLTMLAKAVTGNGPARGLDDTLRSVRTVGEVTAVVALVALWLLAMSPVTRTMMTRAVATRGRLPRHPHVLGCAAAAFGVAALLGPSVQPWYYLWALVLAGLVVARRLAQLALATVALVFPIMITPSGVGLESNWAAVPVIVCAIALAWGFLSSDAQLDTVR